MHNTTWFIAKTQKFDVDGKILNLRVEIQSLKSKLMFASPESDLAKALRFLIATKTREMSGYTCYTK